MNAQSTTPEAPRAFIHYPRAAIISAVHDSKQRTFGMTTKVKPVYGTSNASLSVHRHADSDEATIRIDIENALLDFRATAPPGNLRAIAAQLIDAAHDIEANPAWTLLPTLSLKPKHGGAA